MAASNRALAALAVFLLSSAAGCGSATATVSGTVTYNKKPVRSGTVMLLGDGVPPVYADLNDEGAFTFSAVPVGKVRMTVSSPDPARPKMERGDTKAKSKGTPDPRWFPLPARFSDPDNSGLQFDVAPSNNVWTVMLRD
jgi:hypothetical protein